MKRPVVVLACVVLSGCASDPNEGYSFRSTYAEGVKTVAVPIFENPTYSKGAETELADAIIKEIQRTTPWRVVGAAEADTTLSGTITSVELQHLSMGRRTGLVQEMAVQMRVDFDWTDNRTGKPLVRRRGFQTVQTFVPAFGTGERLELGRTAAVQEMARDVVAELRSNW